MKQVKKTVSIFLCMIMMFIAIAPPMSVCAASKSIKTTSKRITVYDKTYGKIRVQEYYDQILLKGNTKAINKINKQLKEIYKKFKKGMKSGAAGIVEYAKMDLDRGYKDTYYDKVDATVSYNNGNVICIKFMSKSYFGGVCDTSDWGVTYSLKSGKELNLKQVCVNKPSKIVSDLKQKILAEDSYADISNVTVANVKNMSFYLEPGQKAVVCFGPYELGSGGWTRTYIVKSKYK